MMKNFITFLIEELETNHGLEVVKSAYVHHMATHADGNTKPGSRARRANKKSREEASTKFRNSARKLSKQDRKKAVTHGRKLAKQHILKHGRITHVKYDSKGNPQTRSTRPRQGT